MASKDYSNKTPKRIPETRVVGPSRFVKQVSEIEDSVVISSTPYRPFGVTASLEVSGSEDTTKDVPDLSDITIHTPLFAKQRAGSKEIYYEIVYKVRNSSLNPSNVIGVDARIVGTEPQND